MADDIMTYEELSTAYAAALARIAELERLPHWEVAPDDEYQTDPYIYECTNGIMFRIRGPSLASAPE